MIFKHELKKVFPAIDFDEQQLRHLENYLTSLQRWNKKINLTGFKTAEQMFGKLVLDSLIPFSLSIFSNGEKGMDIGSGGGIPGIVLAIVLPLSEIYSVDKVEKKIVFQQMIKSELNLTNFFPFVGDIDSLKKQPEENVAYDFIVSKAWSQLDRLLETGLYFLKKGGKVIAWKGQKWDEELNATQADVIEQYQLEMSYEYNVKEYAAGGRILVFTKR